MAVQMALAQLPVVRGTVAASIAARGIRHPAAPRRQILPLASIGFGGKSMAGSSQAPEPDTSHPQTPQDNKMARAAEDVWGLLVYAFAPPIFVHTALHLWWAAGQVPGAILGAELSGMSPVFIQLPLLLFTSGYTGRLTSRAVIKLVEAGVNPTDVITYSVSRCFHQVCDGVSKVLAGKHA